MAKLFVAWLVNLAYSLALVFASTWTVVTIAPEVQRFARLCVVLVQNQSSQAAVAYILIARRALHEVRLRFCEQAPALFSLPCLIDLPKSYTLMTGHTH